MEAGLDTVLQGGGIAIFAWYAFKNNEQWRLYLTERNSKLEKAIDKLADVIKEKI
jgi:hypothetical protein